MTRVKKKKKKRDDVRDVQKWKDERFELKGRGVH